MTVQRPGLSRLVVHVTPCRSGGRRSSSVTRLRWCSWSIVPARRASMPSAWLKRWGLTRAQSRVAEALAEGASVPAIAAATGRKEASVRWLIKQIHAKLGVAYLYPRLRRVRLEVLAWPVAGSGQAVGDLVARRSSRSDPVGVR